MFPVSNKGKIRCKHNKCQINTRPAFSCFLFTDFVTRNNFSWPFTLQSMQLLDIYNALHPTVLHLSCSLHEEPNCVCFERGFSCLPVVLSSLLITELSPMSPCQIQSYGSLSYLISSITGPTCSVPA